jgi:hypothetical protein
MRIGKTIEKGKRRRGKGEKRKGKLKEHGKRVEKAGKFEFNLKKARNNSVLFFTLLPAIRVVNVITTPRNYA